jgi:hypothetical protein
MCLMASLVVIPAFPGILRPLALQMASVAENVGAGLLANRRAGNGIGNVWRVEAIIQGCTGLSFLIASGLVHDRALMIGLLLAALAEAGMAAYALRKGS